MFGNSFFGNGAIRKHVVLFGTLFNNIRIERTNDTSVTQHQKVPILYGPREKYIARNTQDPNIEREVAAQLPRMAFELMGLEPDAERRLNPVNNLTYFASGVPGSRLVPAPYIFTFNLYITARFVEDAAKITEQILPYFNPDFNLQAKLVEGVDCVNDIKFTLKNIDMRDNYEGNFAERRILIWTLTFSVRSWIYGRHSSNTNVIRWVNVNYTTEEGSDVIAASTNTYPTLANTALEDILPTDDYIIETDISEFFDD